jgi:hypothetical protein
MSKVFQWSCACALVMGVLTTQRLGGQPPLHPVATTPWNAKAEWAGRLVIGEYGTGSACEICHFIAETYNGLMRRYPSTVFIALSYHMDYDWFMSDPADSVFDRERLWYARVDKAKCGSANSENETWAGQIPLPCSMWPGIIMDGRSPIPFKAPDVDTNGSPEFFKGASQLWYDRMVAGIDTELGRAPEAFFHAQTTVQGGKIGVSVKVDSITGQHPKLFLRLLLVEDTVALHPKDTVPSPIWDIDREQYWIVYASAHTPALALGLPLPGPGTAKYTFDVAAIQHRILRIRQGETKWVSEVFAKDKEEMLKAIARHPDDRDWRLNPLRLHVVALVQDAQSGEVLQAAMVPVDGKRLALK